MRKYGLDLVVFICGAAVMILELVASRILAPFVGTSTYIWTSIIGIILGSLSLGYWIGGKLSDKKPQKLVLAVIIFSAAIFIGSTTFINVYILDYITLIFKDLKIVSAISTTILFAIPSALLGMVSPYAVKLKIANLDKSGSTVGNLYALSTLGSIIGTFAAGYILIPSMGSEKNLLLIAVVLIVTAFLVLGSEGSKLGLLFCGIFIAGLIVPNPAWLLAKPLDLVDVDTQYGRVWIYSGIDPHSGEKVRAMQINNEYSSAMFAEGDELVFEYTKFYRLAEHFNPDFKNALMIGGAAYSFPKEFIKRYPDAKIDVVEIDPKVTALAREYFNLKDNKNLRIFHEDGRIFLNNNKIKYDVIYGDAFRARSVPSHLTTKEAIEKMYNSLNEEGVLLINIISSIDGDNGRLLRAEYATLKSVFPQVYVFSVTNKNDSYKLQNIMMAAVKSKEIKEVTNDDEVLNGYLKSLWTKEIKNDVPILTDDFCPVEYYSSKID